MSYSPTQTERYLTCPKLWDLSKRWTPRVGGQEDTTRMVIGDAVHAALQHRLDDLRGVTRTNGHESPLIAAFARLDARFEETDEWTREGVEKLVTRIVDRALDALPEVLDGAPIIGTEMDLGGRRIDLLTRHDGRLVVTDFKYRHKLASDWVSEAMEEANISWQLLDYAAAIEDTYGEAPKRVQNVLIIGSPKAMVRVASVELTSRRLDQWRESAEVVWKAMDEHKVHMNLRACRNKGLHFGRALCPMYDACHSPSILGDEAKMPAYYDHR